MLRQLGVLALLALGTEATPTNPFTILASRIIHRDVAIVGGGASGAYAAVRLKEDFGKSIVLIEKAPKLGGHVSTFTDPELNRHFDFGVQTFNDYGPARAFFARLNITVDGGVRVPLTSEYVDFTNGEPVDFTPPPNDARIAALQKFLAVTEPFENYLLPGYFNFPAPADIPEDLLLPFGQFVAKHGIEAAVNQVFQVTGFGAGDMVNELTIYVLGAFGPPMIRAFLGQGYLTPVSRRNIQVYEAIATRLGSDVLYSSTVSQSIRTAQGTALLVKGADGKYTLVFAKRLLIAIEPTAANMAPFSLDNTEKALFNKFSYGNVYAGIVSHPSLPVNVSLVNLPEAAAPDNWLVLPKPAFNIRFDYMGYPSNNWRVIVVGAQTFSSADAQNLVRQNFQTLVSNGVLPANAGNIPLKFKAWSDHGAMGARVTAAELRNDFIRKLYALQGRRGTWWTGGAWAVQFQSILWAFDDILLPRLVAGW